MPCQISPRKIFDENRRKYAQMEEDSFRNYLEALEPGGYIEPRKAKRLRLKAYALTHIDMLKNTMLDTRRDMADLGIPQAYNLFKKELHDLEGTRNHALNGYVKKDIRRKILWHEIGDIWGHANSHVEELPLITLDAQEAENMAA
jgi:hypothetical protein